MAAYTSLTNPTTFVRPTIRLVGDPLVLSCVICFLFVLVLPFVSIPARYLFAGQGSTAFLISRIACCTYAGRSFTHNLTA